MSERPTCSTCRYWDKPAACIQHQCFSSQHSPRCPFAQPAAPLALGQCKRSEPRVEATFLPVPSKLSGDVNLRFHRQSYWPQCPATEWCGDHAPA